VSKSPPSSLAGFKYHNVFLTLTFSSCDTRIREFDSTAVLAFNDRRGRPPASVHISNPCFENFAAGHPAPIKHYGPHSACVNEAIFDDMEKKTVDGYLQDTDTGAEVMAQVFMTTRADSWNAIGPVGWTADPEVDPDTFDGAVEWLKRTTDAKGAWTWNLPSWTNSHKDCVTPSDCVTDRGAAYLMHPDHLKFTQDVAHAVVSATSPTTYRCE
jgi:hypothetical protein